MTETESFSEFLEDLPPEKLAAIKVRAAELDKVSVNGHSTFPHPRSSKDPPPVGELINDIDAGSTATPHAIQRSTYGRASVKPTVMDYRGGAAGAGELAVGQVLIAGLGAWLCSVRPSSPRLFPRSAQESTRSSNLSANRAGEQVLRRPRNVSTRTPVERRVQLHGQLDRNKP